MLVGKISKPIIIFWLLSLLNLLILLQNSCDNTNANSVAKLSMVDVITEDSKQGVEDSDNEAVEVSKETEAQELPHVSTIKLSMVQVVYVCLAYL